MSAIEEKLAVSANHLFLHICLLLFPTSTKFLDETKAQCPLCSEDKYGEAPLVTDMKTSWKLWWAVENVCICNTFRP